MNTVLHNSCAPSMDPPTPQCPRTFPETQWRTLTVLHMRRRREQHSRLRSVCEACAFREKREESELYAIVSVRVRVSPVVLAHIFTEEGVTAVG